MGDFRKVLSFRLTCLVGFKSYHTISYCGTVYSKIWFVTTYSTYVIVLGMFTVILAVLEYQKCPVHSICMRCSVPKQVVALQKINWAMCDSRGAHGALQTWCIYAPNPLTVILLHEKLPVQSRSPLFQTNIMSSDDSLGLGGAQSCSRSDQVPPSCWAAQTVLSLRDFPGLCQFRICENSARACQRVLWDLHLHDRIW